MSRRNYERGVCSGKILLVQSTRSMLWKNLARSVNMDVVKQLKNSLRPGQTLSSWNAPYGRIYSPWFADPKNDCPTMTETQRAYFMGAPSNLVPTYYNHQGEELAVCGQVGNRIGYPQLTCEKLG